MHWRSDHGGRVAGGEVVVSVMLLLFVGKIKARAGIHRIEITNLY